MSADSADPLSMAEPDGASSPEAEALNRRPQLLVVDDQPANIQVLFHAFCEDHQVRMAKSGEQALALCLESPPDLILLDIEMPGMDGYEVCRRLKALESTRDIPVIFVTAHGDDDTEERGLDVGGVDFISKPVKPRIVRARVKAHLALKRQADLLRQWVFLDGLTGVWNRRYFDAQLVREWSRACRDGKPVALLMMDVDFFKRYNDHYGHQAGDDCLRRVAQALKAALKRGGDLLARYGGEEFVCLLPNTDLAGAQGVAAALAHSVKQLAIAHEQSQVAPVVTLSLGLCSCVPGPAVAADAVLSHADAMLYRAKHQGRDQVSCMDWACPSR